MTRTDLLIVGAGFAGFPIAIACAQAGWQVTLVDQHETIEPLPSDPLDQKCTAISSASEGLLKRWGVWSAIESDAQSIQRVHISQKGYLGTVRLQADELDVPALGHVIENRQWLKALSEQVAQMPNIQWLRGETLVSVNEPDEDTLIVDLTSGQSMHTKLLIAADGVNSCVRELVGIGDAHTDYKQSALMSTVKLSKPHEATAYERFTSQGPLALLPRPNNLMSLVWCLPSSDVDKWASADDAEIIERLQTLFGFKLGRINALGPRVMVPLIRREAVQQTGTRTLLLGNAARLLHPVAGQGFNLVLRDLVALLDLIGLQSDDAPQDPAQDPGRASVLEQFVALRLKDQQQVVGLTDTLATGFLGEASMPAHIRGLALMGLDSIGPLRHAFARNTMGYTG